MEVLPVNPDFAKLFLNSYHPLMSGGCLKGAVEILAGYESGWPVFVAVFTTPRGRWVHYNVVLELSRLAWSPMAKCSATTFLRKCFRILRKKYNGLIVTYALPGTDGVLYERAGFERCGSSSGCPWSRRGKGERATPDTIGTGKKLPRFFIDTKGKNGHSNNLLPDLPGQTIKPGDI